MEPRIQYAKTADGVSIAYFSIGEGRPLVYVPPGGSGDMVWKVPILRSWLESLATGRTFLRLDLRGLGLSDRGWNFSPELSLMDVEAVVRKEGLRRFAIFGQMETCATAILYAHRHPEQVSHLVLWCPYPDSRSYFESSTALQAAVAAGEKDWQTLLDVVSLHAAGWDDAVQAREFAGYLRAGADPGRYIKLSEFDLRQQLRELEAPVLVLHRRHLQFPNAEQARQVAASCPNARFVLLEGNAMMPFFGDSQAVLGAIDEFLGEADDGRPDGLTERELEILTLLADGASNEQMARSLTISTRTVERHIGNIYLKIGAHNRAEATAYAFRQGISPAQ